MTNKLYKDIVLEVDIDAKKGAKNQAKETKATFYSYDIQSGIVKINLTKDDHPLELVNGTEVLINVVKLGSPHQKLVYTADIIDPTEGVAHWEIPQTLIGYKGKVRAGVFINLPNGQRLHGGYFKFNMGISEIDTNLDEFEEDFWQGWDEFQKKAEATWSDWEAIRDDVWQKYVEKFEAWKADQEAKQTKFEDDTNERLTNWLDEQERIHTEFENEYSDWKTTQENKQNSFESDTNKTINGINTKVEETQTKVSDLEKNLDVEQKNYFSVEAWEEQANTDVITNDFPTIKIELEGNTKYTLSSNIPKSGNNDDVFFATGNKTTVNTPSDGVSVDKPRTITTKDDGAVIVAIRDKDMSSGDWWIMLNKGSTAYDWTPNTDDLATKQETDKKLAVKADKTEIDSMSEHGLLELEKGFENYDPETNPDFNGTRLQYVRVGSLCHIFGAVKNTATIKDNSEIVLAKMPDNLKITVTDRTVCQGSFNNTFLAQAKNLGNKTFPSQITISRTRNNGGTSVDFGPGCWLNVSLTCAVEVIN